KSVKQLRTMAYDAAVLLVGSRQESRDVDKRNQRNIEAVAGPHESRPLLAGSNVEHSGQMFRLVGNDAHWVPPQARKAHDEILAEFILPFQECVLVYDGLNHGQHVIGFVGGIGHNVRQLRAIAVGGIRSGFKWWRVEIIWRQVG